MLQRLEVNAVWKLAHHLIQEVDWQIAVSLQAFHPRLTSLQAVELGLQTGDFLDLLIKLGDFGAQQRVALGLVLDAHLVPGEHTA